MSETIETVYVIDDDDSIRVSLGRLLAATGLNVQTYPSASNYLAERPLYAAGCLVLDLNMPELNGLELQAKLANEPSALPIIFLTAVGDVPTSVMAIKAGAIDFLMKPVEEERLLSAISSAFASDRVRRNKSADSSEARSRLARLSQRELEVMRLIASGYLNKQIAARLGTSEKTIKVHRAHLLQKLEIVSVAELMRLVIATERSS